MKFFSNLKQKIFSRFSSPKKTKKTPFSSRLPKILLRLVLVLIILVIGWGAFRFYVVPKIISQRENGRYSQIVPLQKTVIFPALLDSGKYNGEISLSVVSAERTNEVMVKNKPIRANKDRFFLIINLELKNESTQKVGVVTSDLLRLKVDKNGTKLAPDLHNKLVLVSPVSTKSDKVGFVVVGQTGIPLTLELGEFYKNKEVKEQIEINF